MLHQQVRNEDASIVDREPLCPLCLTQCVVRQPAGVCVKCGMDYDVDTGWSCPALRCTYEESLCPVCAWPDIVSEVLGWVGFHFV